MLMEAKSTTNSLRMRSKPNLRGEVVGRLNINEQVGILCSSDEPMEADGVVKLWYFVCTKTGVKGWVFGGYLVRVDNP